MTDDILSIILAAGWALLLGNMVFQATKSMATGLGFEGEDPKLLFTRTFVFGFFLLASQQICQIGLGISNHIITLLQIPSSVTVTLPDENCFDIGASWLLVIIVGIVIMWQVVKLFFEIAERYVVTALLVILSPLAFAMGGSKNTADIFKGWCRMFGSMCAMMVLNVIFLKLLISAMGYMPSGVAVLPWMLLIVGIARTARKADSIIARMGLNPAITGDGLGRGLPGMVAYAVIRSVGSTVTKTMRHSAGKNNTSGGKRAGGPAHGGRSTPPPSPPPSGGSGNGQSAPPPSGGGQGGTAVNGTPRAAADHTRQGAGGTPPGGTGTAGTGANPGTGARPTQGGQQPTAGQQPTQKPAPGSGAQARPAAQKGARRSSVRPGSGMGTQTGQNPSGGAGGISAPTAEASGGGVHEQQEAPQRPPIPRVRLGAQPQAGGSGKPGTGESRKSSVVHTASETVTGSVSSAQSSTQTNTQQTRAAKPIRQDGTPKISPPPGVTAVGRGERHSSGTAGTRRVSNSAQPPVGGSASPSGMAGTRKAPGLAQPPAGGSVPPSGTAGTRKAPGPAQPPTGGSVPPSGMAGTRKAPGPAQPPVGGSVPPSGMAGTHKAPGPTQPPVGGSASPSGMAGTRKAPGLAQPPAGGSVPPSGTAGTRKAPGPAQPPVGGSVPPSGMAGTRKAPGPVQPPAGGSVPPSGMAGTHKAPGPAQPPVGGSAPPSGTAGTAVPDAKKNCGTKRITQKTSQAQMTGGARQKKTDRRRKGGPNIG